LVGSSAGLQSLAQQPIPSPWENVASVPLQLKDSKQEVEQRIVADLEESLFS
jgi:hypothetical protein